MKPQRLDGWLAAADVGSRSETRKLVRRGKVQVDGVTVTSQSAPVTDDQVITVDGKRIEPPPRGTIALLMHKPAGLSCSHDEREAPLIYELVSEHFQRWSPQAVGRLDRDTTGLLLLTSDGALNHRLVHPKRKVAKRYRVGFDGELMADAVERCAAGLPLPDDDQPCLPAELTIEGPDRATLVLHEGRFHQVKRMFEVLGGTVTSLHRDRFGGLDLPADLEPGMVRPATDTEMAVLLAEFAPQD